MGTNTNLTAWTIPIPNSKSVVPTSAQPMLSIVMCLIKLNIILNSFSLLVLVLYHRLVDLSRVPGKIFFVILHKIFISFSAICTKYLNSARRDRRRAGAKKVSSYWGHSILSAPGGRLDYCVNWAFPHTPTLARFPALLVASLDKVLCHNLCGFLGLFISDFVEFNSSHFVSFLYLNYITLLEVCLALF